MLSKERIFKELENLTVATTACVAFATFGSVFTFIEPLLDNLVSFRAFYVGFCAFAICLLLARRNMVALLAAGLLVLNLAPVLPWYAPSAPQPTRGPAITASTINMLGPWGDLDQLEAELDRVASDIVFVCEVIPSSRDRLLPLYPHTVWSPDAPHIAVLSKFPVVSSEIHTAGKRPMYDVVLDTPVGHVRVFGVHAMSPLMSELVELRGENLQVLSDLSAGSREPVIALGDFNITMFSPDYSRLGDHLVSAREGRGIQGTWPASSPARIPIDHIFTSDDLVTLNAEVGGNFGSDHRPFHATIGARRNAAEAR